ncbi:HAD family hydrolase [Alicyclobacillus sp. ALC3]|uniref:HAD family hydrolase n=1 Tax=Alicyclobacillus sp. ALC3 TaxID=2796143 RepID=UPI002379699D|nr:HAD family hydrolase [Alicyclobacillus sp. ALC3]WDL95906.1 HAD family hydrolase [Alicyclobacillus sp. ALC3]
MKAYTTILFDLDGTLTDPKVGITKSVQFALAKLGIAEPDLEKLTPFIGPPLHVNFQRVYHFSPSQVQLAVEYYRQYFKEGGMYENVPYDGITRLLKSLKRQSRRLIVATSKPTVFAEQILNHFDLSPFFDCVIGSNLDGTRSDKSEVISYVMSQYGDIPKADFVMVGDREHDIIGAHSSGIHCVGVTYGYGSRDELMRVNPTHAADTVYDLFEILGC